MNLAFESVSEMRSYEDKHLLHSVSQSNRALKQSIIQMSPDTRDDRTVLNYSH